MDINLKKLKNLYLWQNQKNWFKLISYDKNNSRRFNGTILNSFTLIKKFVNFLKPLTNLAKLNIKTNKKLCIFWSKKEI